jgi:hypothetical protein
MTKDEALKLALEYIETNAHERRHVRWAIKEALAQPEQEPVAGKGKEYSEQLKLCARNVAFVSAGRVNMGSAAMQEMFALIDHVCAGIDSPPQPEQLVAHREGFWCVDLTCKKCYSADFRFKHKSSVDKKSLTTPAQPEERNFCQRCGKRTADSATIHTCTPPRENT